MNAPEFVISVKDHPNQIIPIDGSDIALLDVQPQTPKPLTLFADVSPQLTVGATLHAYGFPLGNPAVPLRGALASSDTNFRNFSSTRFNLQEGYSGFPIADDMGDIIGVNSCGVNGYEYISLMRAAYTVLQKNGVRFRENISIYHEEAKL